jgi:hypothetical protein
VRASGATALGPTLAEGQIVLIGGRRALVAKDGSVKTETAPTPEPLLDLVAVPTAQGMKLVGFDGHHVHRFDDPLGAPITLAHTDETITRLGAGPGRVAVWLDRSELPMMLDVATGAPKPLAGLPAPPLSALFFLDENHGAGVFQAIGLAVTSDGGKTWHEAADAGRGDAVRMGGFRVRGGALRAFAYVEGPDALVDINAATLGALEPTPDPSGTDADAPLVRWVRATERDPIELAAEIGVDLGNGVALVASHGMVAKVDLRAGVVTELLQFAKGRYLTPCALARTGQSAWIGCAVSEEEVGAGRDLFDPWAVMRVPLEEPKLRVEKPVLVRSGEAELRSSPSGGLMVTNGGCEPKDDGQLCVRQPDGKWSTVRTNVDLFERGAGPLADGRVAVVRYADEIAEEGQKVSAAAFVVAIDATGAEKVLAPLGSHAGEALSLRSPIEEDGDHSLRFTAIDDTGGLAFVARPGSEPAEPRKVAGAFDILLRGQRGAAVTSEGIALTTDGGASWVVRATEGNDEMKDWIATIVPQDRSTFNVGEVGARIGGAVRIGWGAEQKSAQGAPSAALVELKSTRPKPHEANMMSCSSQGAAQVTSPPLGSAGIRELLGGGKAPKGVKRVTSTWTGGRSVLDTVAILDEEGKEGASEPTKWTLRWYDPTAIGDKPRTWSGAPPKGIELGTQVRNLAASGPRVMFSARGGGPKGKHFVARLKGSTLETAELSPELVPSSYDAPAFAEGSETVAWLRETYLVVWPAGGAPHAIARVAPGASRTLSTPTKDGVSLLVASNDWAIERTILFGAADKTSGPPPALTLDGWAPARNLAIEAVALPACAPKPKGPRYVIPRSPLRTEVDGQNERGTIAVFDVRGAGQDACVAQMTALLTPDRRTDPPHEGEKPKGKKKKKTDGPVAFVRVDLIGKRAEGGDRGVGPDVSVRKLACTIGPARN